MAAASTRFTAGCGRVAERSGADAALPELAYTELAFPECPGCPHRVEPERSEAFCRWLAPGRGPRAALAALEGLL